MISFASAVGIDPGIVVGRLQNDGVINHNVLNELKTHYQLSVMNIVELPIKSSSGATVAWPSLRILQQRHSNGCERPEGR